MEVYPKNRVHIKHTTITWLLRFDVTWVRGMSADCTLYSLILALVKQQYTKKSFHHGASNFTFHYPNFRIVSARYALY